MVLIVTGHQRSGTTLLMRLCNTHPEISLTSEFGNFYHLDQPYAAYRRFILQRWWQKRNAAFLDDRQQRLKGANSLVNLGFVIQYLRQINLRKIYLPQVARTPLGDRVGVETIEAALKSLYPGASLVGDKYPDYVFRLRYLTPHPNLRTLVIYRDPRDVASSSVLRTRTDWQQFWPEELRDPANVARRWVEFAGYMERHAGKIHLVRYEDLVTGPREVMEGIGRWLGIDPAGFDLSLIRPDRVGKHKQGLTDEETAAVLDIAGPTMQRWGYPVSE